MAYKDQFNRTISLDGLDDTSRLVLEVIMREGELRFRDEFISSLEDDINKYLSEVDDEPNMEWINGVRYVIHLLKEAAIVEY